MDKIKTGEIIREARKAKNYTQSELGDMIGVTNKAVSRWEKGESFPDIGILENLAQVLDLKIQDIVVGEISQTEVADANTEQTLAELLRQSRMQLREKRKKIIALIIAAVLFICAIMAGIVGLSGSTFFFDSPSGMIYFVMFGLTLMLIVYGWHVQGSEAVQCTGIDKVLCIISGISVIWCIIVTAGVAILSAKGLIPYGFELNKTGPFINLQLILVFVLNVLFAIAGLCRWVRVNGEIHMGFVVKAAAIYITALYGDLLHRLDGVSGFLFNLCIRTCVVFAGTAIAILYMRILAKRRLL